MDSSQADLLRRTVEQLESQNVDYMVVGSLASMAYGEPRLTRDIDVVVDLKQTQVDALCNSFPSDEFYVSLDAARRAVLERGQFNVIHPTSGNKIDFILARDDAWGREQLSRSRRVQILPGLSGCAAGPEDVILGKLLYYREGGSEKHLRDVAGMMQVSSNTIDSQYIIYWANQLNLLTQWQALLDRMEEAGN